MSILNSPLIVGGLVVEKCQQICGGGCCQRRVTV